MNTSTVSTPGMNFTDQFSLALLFAVTVIVLILFIEVGFRLGNRRQGKSNKAQTTQVRAIMTTTLGLIAFLLAFTFAIAQEHFETRVANLAEEARLTHNAFLYAEYLDAPYRAQARKLLRDYVTIRLLLEETSDPDQWNEVLQLIGQSEEIQRNLWELSSATRRSGSDDVAGRAGNSAFGTAVVGLIDIHNARIQAELANRVSWVVWATLYLAAVLGMLQMGYHAGMSGRRSPIATFTLAITFALVMMLITDLDRPMTSMFKMSNQSLVILADNMDEMLENE